MRFTRSGGIAAGVVIGGLLGFSLSLGDPPGMQVESIGGGALFGLVGAVIIVVIDGIMRPATRKTASPATGNSSGPKSADFIVAESSESADEVAKDSQEPIEPDLIESRFEASVREAFETIRNPKTNWVQTLVVLAVSVAVFMRLHMQSSPIAFTVMLVGVLFFHELGHYLGMQFFGYRNVRMFFIPLFGAAVSGQATSGKSYQQAIVTLLGPLPGLCAALALFGVLWVPGLIETYRIEVAQLATLLAIINGFNLLPVLPLDGGRLLNQIFFSRNRYLEATFHLLAGIALIAYGASRGQQVLWWIGVWLVISARPTFKTNSIAARVSSELSGPLPPMDASIPLPMLRAILAEIKSELPGAKTTRAVANATFCVWEKIHVQPPGAILTVGMLLVYLLGATVAIGTTALPTGNSPIELSLQQIARDANKNSPKWLDAVTRLDRIEAGPGKTISYIYTATRDLPEQQKQGFSEDIAHRALADPKMQAILSAGVTVWYKYYDMSGRLLLGVPVYK